MFFGSGKDGDQVYKAQTVSLTKDTYYTNLSLTDKSTLITAGYRLFIRGTLHISEDSNINNNGSHADLNGPGKPAKSGSIGGGISGSVSAIVEDGLFNDIMAARTGRTLNGSIVDGGLCGAGKYGGGGGGVVIISAVSITGNGYITANGGNACEVKDDTSYSGSGGIIVVIYHTKTLPDTHITNEKNTSQTSQQTLSTNCQVYLLPI